MKQEKIVGMTNSVTGFTSVLGSWQICHNLCLGIIALLGIAGITLTGMPLFFFKKIAVPLWFTALALLLLTVYLYASRKCISRNLIFLNSGLIIAGTPFHSLQPLQAGFWTAGGALAVIGIAMYIREKYQRKKAAGANMRKTIVVLLAGILGLLVLSGCSNSSSSTATGGFVPDRQILDTKSTGSIDTG